MATPFLVTIDVRFQTSEDAEQVAERIREAVRMIVGRDALDHFRWRKEPLEPPKDRLRPR
jgi:acetylornithine deacetylase/succinyl-diaminopimelate desuccinylase-like protein